MLISWATSLALVATLALRRAARALPVFFCFTIFELLLGMAFKVVQTYCTEHSYLLFWNSGAYVDMIFNCAVIVELGANLYRHSTQRQQPRFSFILGIFLLMCIAFIRLIQWRLSPRPFIWRLTVHTEQITALVQLAAFLTLIIWSGFGTLRWPRREFRVGFGMGLLALVGFVIATVNSYPAVRGAAYRWVEFVLPVFDLFVMFYWLHFFLHDDSASAPRIGRAAEFISMS